MKIILGDNPFFGINHASARKGKVSGKKLREIFTAAAKCELSILMLSRHENHFDVVLHALQQARSDGNGLDIALVAPLPHRYNDIVASRGYLGLRKAITGEALLLSILIFILRGNLFRRIRGYIAAKLIKNILYSEMKPVIEAGLRVRYFCLHNVFTDLLVAADGGEWLEAFKAASESLGGKAVYITQNAISTLHLTDPDTIICASINRFGYMMFPSRAEVTTVLKATERSVWAMQFLAGGQDDPGEALAFLKDLNVCAAVYATSKPERIYELEQQISGG